MDALEPSARPGRIGRMTGRLVTLLAIMTGFIQIYQWINDKPQPAQLQLPQQPLRVELVNPPAVVSSASPPMEAKTLPEQIIPHSGPPNMQSMIELPLASPPNTDKNNGTSPTIQITAGRKSASTAFVIAAVDSTNETSGQRGQAMLSFDGDPSTFYSFLAKSDPTVITVAPTQTGASLQTLRYKTPSGIQIENLVTDFVIETQTPDGQIIASKITIDPLREGWQTIKLHIENIATIRLKPQSRYNGRLMSIGDFRLL